MPGLGFVLLLLVAAGIIGTGLPAAVVLIAAASLGVATATMPLDVRGALLGRLIKLFANDHPQALLLDVTMGLQLDRLPGADALIAAGNRQASQRHGPPAADAGRQLGLLDPPPPRP